MSELNGGRVLLEKKIERVVCEYARSRGHLAYKFTSPQRAAVPDRLMIAPGGFVYFIEFKAYGKKPTPQQMREHERLRVQGVNVYVIDNIDDGKGVVDGYPESK